MSAGESTFGERSPFGAEGGASVSFANETLRTIGFGSFVWLVLGGMFLFGTSATFVGWRAALAVGLGPFASFDLRVWPLAAAFVAIGLACVAARRWLAFRLLGRLAAFAWVGLGWLIVAVQIT